MSRRLDGDGRYDADVQVSLPRFILMLIHFADV